PSRVSSAFLAVIWLAIRSPGRAGATAILRELYGTTASSQRGREGPACRHAGGGIKRRATHGTPALTADRFDLWLHLLGLATYFGATVYLLLAILPAARRITDTAA